MRYISQLFTTFTFFVIFFFISCANNTIVNITDSNNTLRAKTILKDENTLWTSDIDANKLLQNITTNEAIDNSVILSPATSLAANINTPAVFPFIKDFGSLDTSLLFQELRSVVDRFSSAILKGESVEDLISDGNLFSYVFFIEDLTNDFKAKYNIDYKKTQSKIFTKVKYGAPFLYEQSYDVPLRFEFVNGYVDVLILITQNNDVYKINQIEIQKWGNANGQ